MEENLPRIVVGVHGSAGSLAALRWAVREAGLLTAQLHVVRAWQDEARWLAPYAPHARLPGREEAREIVGAALSEAVRAEIGSSPAAPLTVEVTEGLAARVLLECALGARFLVLGGEARSARDGVGPVARACLLRAPCPVVVVSAEMARQAPVPV